MQVTSKNRQSLADLAILHGGAVEAVFAIADRNGVAITDDPAVGGRIEVNPSDVAKRQVVARLAAYGAAPTMGITAADADSCPCGGVGYMALDYDFTVTK